MERPDGSSMCKLYYRSSRSHSHSFAFERLRVHEPFIHFQLRSNEAASPIKDWSSQLAETQVLLCRDNTDSIGVSLSSAPALYTDNHISFTEDAKTNGLLDTPLESAVDIFLPIRFLKVWLLFWELEWVYAAVQM